MTGKKMHRRSLLTVIFSLIATLPFRKVFANTSEYEYVKDLGDGYILKRRLLPKEAWSYQNIPNYTMIIEKDGKIFRG